MQDLHSVLSPLYGKEKSQELVHRIQKYGEEIPQPYVFEKEPNWYKNLNFYIAYPHTMEGPHEIPLQNLKDHLDWVKQLGCNAIHILPFLDSPMIDKGFDISDFYKVRPELGTLEDIQQINIRARELGLKVFMDIVANHISEQHEWFKKAENGDEFYREYFLYSKERPQFVKRVENEHGIYGEYIVNGQPKLVYIVFPETAGDIPHWHQGKDGYWYYHTFYPQQLDLNWFNPEVFFEFAKIIIHWSSFGFHFRLDAIPFVGKGIYKSNENDDTNTHAIVQGLYQISRMINPNCAFLVETYESMESVINYFGTTNSPETTVSYNFHLCTATWLTLEYENTSYFKDVFNKTNAVPIHAEWITFLRNHDELSIAFIDEKLREDLVKRLAPKGAEFRGGHGLAGRTYSLLGSNYQRMLMAFCLLASIPGSMGIMYGDEVGMENVPFEELSEEERKDTRNINRGMLKRALLEDQGKKTIYNSICDILNKRRFISYYLNIEPLLEDLNDNKVLKISYKHGISQLVMYINVCSTEQFLKQELSGFEPVLKLNQAMYTAEEIKLGPYGCIWVQR